MTLSFPLFVFWTAQSVTKSNMRNWRQARDQKRRTYPNLQAQHPLHLLNPDTATLLDIYRNIKKRYNHAPVFSKNHNEYSLELHHESQVSSRRPEKLSFVIIQLHS